MSNDNTTALTPGLYIVPTPIGNLQDITLRALNVLANVDIIAAEDTRHTKILLQHFAINARLISIHDHNEIQQVDAIIDKLKQGLSIALVSDAGTPLINDPGYHLVHRCQKENLKVIPLPGPCAAITALSASGLPSDRFCYEGFLPAKTKARKDKLLSLVKEPRTVIFYESTHRILDCLVDIIDVFGSERQIVLAKELTKTWETIYSAPVSKLYDWLKEDETRCRGEIVLIVESYKSSENEEDALPTEALETLVLLQEELSLTKACALTAKIHHIKKNKLYQYALSQQQTK